MNEFVSWCRHLLVSFLFHVLTSLHPPSFHRNDFSTCIFMTVIYWQKYVVDSRRAAILLVRECLCVSTFSVAGDEASKK